MALRYLNDGKFRNPSVPGEATPVPEVKIPIPDATKPIKTARQLRIIVFSELNFLIISHKITKIVGKIITNDNAFMPDAPTNDAEVLSNINENMVKLIENIGSAQIEKFSFFNQSPLKVMLVDDIRWQRCDIKSTSLLGNVLQMNDAKSVGCNEILMHKNGELTEGGASNIFFVKNKTIFNPFFSKEFI